MQMSYDSEMGRAVAGMLVDDGPKDVVSGVCLEALEFGRVVAIAGDMTGTMAIEALNPTNCQASQQDGPSLAPFGLTMRDIGIAAGLYAVKDTAALMIKGRLWCQAEQPMTMQSDCFVRFNGKRQVQTITLDADLIADNILSAKFDGVEITQTYGTDHLATMTAFAAKIALLSKVVSATVGGAGNRVITIKNGDMGVELAITDEAVTGALTQANVVVVETFNAVPLSSAGKFRTTADNDSDGNPTAVNVSSNPIHHIGSTIAVSGGYLVPVMINII